VIFLEQTEEFNMSLCRICGEISEEFLDLGMQPFANKYPKNQQDVADEIKMKMAIEFCTECKSAQISSVVDRNLMFEDYYYLSSVNSELVKHFTDLAENELSKCKFVVDIGSNDGILLRPLKKNGIKCLGIDPSQNVGELANKEGLETIISFYNQAVGRSIKHKFGVPDAIVASSVFTHIENPSDFISDLKIICNDRTSIYIEIEYLKNLLNNLQFERFYFDRPHYYSVHGMKELFSREGFDLTSVKEINPHGGSLRLKFQLKSANAKIEKSVDDYLLDEMSSLSSDKISNFALSVVSAAKYLKNQLIELKESQKTVIGFGCPARVATITNFCGIDSSLIEYIAEDSPLKIDRLSPGKHIPIIDSKKLKDMDFDVFIVFAYEYFESIKSKTEQYNIPYYLPIPFSKIKD
jgi:methylation protein EvaC